MYDISLESSYLALLNGIIMACVSCRNNKNQGQQESTLQNLLKMLWQRGDKTAYFTVVYRRESERTLSLPRHCRKVRIFNNFAAAARAQK